jgi:hypothetical protein
MKEKKFKILSHFWLHANTQYRNLEILPTTKKKKKKTLEKLWQLENFRNTCFLLTKELNSSKEKKE